MELEARHGGAMEALSKHCHRKPSAKGMQHGDHPGQSPGRRMLGHLNLGPGMLELSLKLHKMP